MRAEPENGPLAGDVQQAPRRRYLGFSPRLGPGRPRLAGPVGARGQPDDRGADDGRTVAVFVGVGPDGRLGFLQRGGGVALPQGTLGEQAAGDIDAEPVLRPQRLQPYAPLGGNRPAPGHVNEQGHRRQQGFFTRRGRRYARRH